VKDVLSAVRLAADERIALGTVVEVKRSAPRPPGAKMAVSASGAVHGAVSGGCVEGAVVELATEVLAGAPPQLVRFGIADEEAWDVGLPCGGEIGIWIEAYGSEEQTAFAALADADGRGALVTDVAEATRMLVAADGVVVGTLGSPERDAVARAHADDLMWAERSELRDGLFVDATFPAPRLIVFGAIDLAGALCTLARELGWRSFVVDPRSQFTTRERFPDAEQVVAAWPVQALETLGGIDRATFVVVLTHDPKLDDAVLEIALRSAAGYVGAMGSRRAQERRRERLVGVGLTEDQLARLSAPIGLDLGAVTPEETALSVMAEIVAVRRERGGGRLHAAAGRIH
jgi:xanthine dehydrogenase accessory factor